jgi:chromodomain-helicase-DNA-binding protein 4
MQKPRARLKDVSGAEYDTEEVPDSEEETEGDDDDYEDADTHDLRRSSRTAASGSRKKTIKNLPFSPRKTRSRKVVGDSDDELAGFDEEEVSEVVEIPARRSTRARKCNKANLAEDAYEDEGDEDDDSSSRRTRKRTEVKKRKPPRTKASRPAYGSIRDVADLDYDPFSDNETLPLRAHRDSCEKCRKLPSHSLLLAMKKRPKGKGRKKKSSDDEDDEGNEEDRLMALGGWVRW